MAKFSLFPLAPTAANLSNEYLTWINGKVDAKVNNVEDLCTGAVFCQLLHRLHPSSINLRKVIFYTNQECDFMSNYLLLQQSLNSLKVNKSINITRVIRYQFMPNLKMLIWFRKYYDSNYQRRTGLPYNPKTERFHKTIGYRTPIDKLQIVIANFDRIRTNRLITTVEKNKFTQKLKQIKELCKGYENDEFAIKVMQVIKAKKGKATPKEDAKKSSKKTE
ncbi:microtubule-associated protein RP/EB family member 3-like [Teleopsis dalmanni]|uniref:microtubule-associated protein RP/EB family member 3-like n=1 Tax=Teleopsis dalmanni TaxID=139649 RepID=UPI0018CF0154|nr:microtubule-associated protein RP/EB family member 3-like [Teleopsis dalmanni]XP_037960260.1 microtubule-associated protein RP/EB family member 3-like [Teleopsis dalmanni]